MNGFHILVFAFTIVGAVVLIPWAIRADRADREWSGIREWHLLHGHMSGCLECESK